MDGDNFNELIIGALLSGFDVIYIFDIAMIVEDFKSKNAKYLFKNIESPSLKKIVSIDNDKIKLRSGITLGSLIDGITVKNFLTNMVSDVVLNYFYNLNINIFTLLKLRKLSYLDDDDMNIILSSNEKVELQRLIDDGMVAFDDTENSIFRKYSITKRGTIELYKYDHKTEYDDFVLMLRRLRCDLSIIDDYLLEQSFDFPVWSIFSINFLIDFCKEYKRCLFEKGAQELNFQSFNDESNIFNLNDNETMFFCHPNNIIKGIEPLNGDINYMLHINWDDIDIEKMFLSNEYEEIVVKDSNFVLKRLNELLSVENNGYINDPNSSNFSSYKAIIVGVNQGDEVNYKLIGIAEYDFLGLKLAINPDYSSAFALKLKNKHKKSNH